MLVIDGGVKVKQNLVFFYFIGGFNLARQVARFVVQLDLV